MLKKIIVGFWLLSALVVIKGGFSQVFAAVTPCDQQSGVPCTICKPNDDYTACILDANQSTCDLSGYYPDLSFCGQYTNTMYICDMPAKADCLETPNCKNSNESCTGTNGTQGTCCDGLVCNNSICALPATCSHSGEICPGPAGTQGGCCDSNQWCQYKIGGELVCQDKSTITGYFCGMDAICNPCYLGMNNFGCDPPEYTNYKSCDDACTGQVPLKFACNPTTGDCNESQNGSYTDLPRCETACGGNMVFCNSSKQVSSYDNETTTPYINSALGCIDYKTAQFVSSTLKWSMGVGGGIAFLVIVWGSVLIITGGHDPKKIQAGQEMITAAISGIIMIIICLLLINYLGDKVLNLGPIGFRQ